jgi:glutamine amidotransferase
VTALAILDLGYGNIDSIRLAFARLGAEVVLTSDAQSPDRLVIPGVGAAGFAMQKLRDAGLVEPLRRRTKPTLGICLGMQLMFDSTDEGDTETLALIPGRVRQMTPAPGSPVPHMGWSKLSDVSPDIGLENNDFVYFAHSFACPDTTATAARVAYDARSVTAVVRQGNLWGAQFHPERSSTPGANFLKAFLSA